MARTALASSGPRRPWSLGRLRVDRALIPGMGGLVLALLVPLVLPGPRLGVVTAGFVYALIALTLVVLTGWTGQISLAQFSFVGVGAFTAGHLAGSHGQHFWPWPRWPSRWSWTTSCSTGPTSAAA